MNTILFVGAIVILFLLIGFLLKVVRAAITTAIGIVLIVLVLQFGFGVEVQDVWGEVNNIWENILRLLRRN
ncbi:hypothetical protein [Leptolyngbya sp. FACHB-711]|jgi:L-cystine uptake protein TcyP (sodium:dicarboxylate symporter family)|uniref:hypothetical protein n=1 Tax=unclassified Leptolyngbya TaxID=2650499 RepID=UPI00168968B6|nr:hypothetical protein [Leptolyngbya sp. FACHB-711]MBD1850065.1 hypothetical protein [Cyanobacteria bacterium FACHB-502]MBD2024785.1 hypothetical protein [Leptolyngbya sp. FACHB-711]